jgi:integrase
VTPYCAACGQDRRDARELNREHTHVEAIVVFATQGERAQVAIAGLPWVTLKGLRHTHATLLLELGEHPKVVQERLGHSPITTTMNIYSHVTPTMQKPQ